MATHSGRIWFVGASVDGDDARPVLNGFDIASEQVDASLELRDQDPIAVAAEGDALWILDYDGSVTHVEV